MTACYVHARRSTTAVVSAVLGLVAALAAGCHRSALTGPGGAPRAEGPRGPTHRGPSRAKVVAAAFSPDNKYVVTAFRDSKKALTLWDVATGKEVRNFKGQRYYVLAVAFAAGGKRLLSASSSGLLLLHDVATGKETGSAQAYANSDGRGALLSLMAASPDGSVAVTVGHDRDVEVAKAWAAADGLKELLEFGEASLQASALAVSPGGKWALTGSAGGASTGNELVRLWDLGTGRVKYSLRRSDGWECYAAGFSPDSALALVNKAAHAGTEREVRGLALWDVKTGKVVRLLEGTGGPPAQFTPDGKRVVGVTSYGKDKIRVAWWDVASGKRVRAVDFPKARDRSDYWLACLSPDGRLAFVATGGVYEGPRGPDPLPRTSLRLAVWDLEAGRVLREWNRPPADE